MVVLDQSFQGYLAAPSMVLPAPDRVMLAIALSGWVRRVWTLQEALLARKLIFEVQGDGLNFDVDNVVMRKLRDVIGPDAPLPAPDVRSLSKVNILMSQSSRSGGYYGMGQATTVSTPPSTMYTSSWTGET